jgi:hypothetical protein
MIQRRGALYVLVAVLTLTLSPGRDAAAQRNEDRKPSVSLKATPPSGFTPLRVRLVVEVRGGADDFADFYCPAIEWEWGDDQTSESDEDCAPYEAGKSQIRRRYSTEHVYRDAGGFTARFRLKQGDRVVANATTNVQVRPGIRDDFDQ